MNQSIKVVAIAAFASLLAFGGCTNGGGDDRSGGDGSGNVTEIGNACTAIGLNPRIINGDQCVSEQSSPVVRILFALSGGRQALCSGSMLTSRHVLTAAHCFASSPLAAAVQIGNRQIPVTDVEVHPNFRQGPTSFDVVASFDDVAIMTLGEDAGVPTLPVLISREIDSGDPIAIYGYGLDENKGLGVLRGGKMTLNDVTADHFTSNFNGTESDTCEGDSGGPAVVNTETGLAIVGVTSSGTVQSCTPGDLAIFANAQSGSIISFIQDNVPGVRIQ